MADGKTFGYIACGVGGQGVVLMCNIIGEACARSGHKAISGEMHGLAQRSGSVFIHQRIGDAVLSPLIPSGEADAILSLELMESLRHIHFLKPGGTIVTNSRLLQPSGQTQDLVMKKMDGYVKREDIEANIAKAGAKLIQIDALALATEAGNPLTENVVMVGAICGLDGFPLEADVVRDVLQYVVPPKAVDVNIRAFNLGHGSCCQQK